MNEGRVKTVVARRHRWWHITVKPSMRALRHVNFSREKPAREARRQTGERERERLHFAATTTGARRAMPAKQGAPSPPPLRLLLLLQSGERRRPRAEGRAPYLSASLAVLTVREEELPDNEGERPRRLTHSERGRQEGKQKVEWRGGGGTGDIRSHAHTCREQASKLDDGSIDCSRGGGNTRRRRKDTLRARRAVKARL